jgi:hypothetical protein
MQHAIVRQVDAMNSCKPRWKILHAAVLQACPDTTGLALGRALAAIGAGDLVEIAHQIAS